MQMLAALAFASAVPTMAMMNSQTSMPTAPQMSNLRRPSFSIVQKDIGVLRTLTRFVMMVMVKLFLMPTVSKNVVP
jgi:hypothetical protein